MTSNDHVSPLPPPDAPPGPPRSRLRNLWLPALILLGVLVLVAFGPAARLAANRLPLPPDDPTPVAQGTTRDGTTALRTLPVGLPTGARVASIQDISRYAVAALGVPGAQALTRVLSSDSDLKPTVKSGAASEFDFAYPYQYAALEPILDSAPLDQLRRNANQLAAALIQLAGQPRASKATENSARAAYALLDRTRSLGGCDAQLNLFLLVAADASTSQEVLADEYRRSSTACPNEPTPDWIAGQAQIRGVRYVVQPRPGRINDPSREALTKAIAVFQESAARFPNDTSVITGLGDAYLRSGLVLLYAEPFTARDNLRLAVAQYNRAAELGDVADADLGRARAFIGLGDPETAVKLAERAAINSPHPGTALEVLLAAQQAAHHFDRAIEVGQRLENAGPASYPASTAFFPLPTSDDRGLPFDATLPLSTGADTLAPMQTSLVPTGGAGGTVEDLSFIPAYRDDSSLTATLADCPSLAWRRDSIVAGQAARALTSWPANFFGVRPDGVDTECAQSSDVVRSIAKLAAQQQITEDGFLTKDELTDKWQNLLRWSGDLPGARTVITNWDAEVGDNNPMPALRLGEVTFLQGNYNQAAAQFGVAARRTRMQEWDNDLAVAQAQLARGATLFKQNRNVEAVALLRPLEELGVTGYALQTWRRQPDTAAKFAAVSYFAAAQLADYENATGDLHAAVDDYNIAASWPSKLTFEYGLLPEAVENNLAVAYLGIGETDRAQTSVAKAIDSDPMNPVFLMTAGFIAERAGNTAEAVSYNRRALHSDPTAFAAANDLGVELARAHDYRAAEVALRQAVGAAPDYALGWFNLGVLEGTRGPLYLLASQGALAKAFTLDPTLKDRRHELTIDGSVYRTSLDLSKPLPPKWSLAQTQKAAPATTAGLLAVALLGLGLARSSASQRGSDLAKQWLEPIAKRLNRIRSPKRVIWAVVATVASFLFAYLHHAGSVTEVVTYCLGLVAMTGLAIYARVAVAARLNVTATQTSWLPGMIFGLVTGAIGTPWAPLPVTKTDTESRRLHRAAPLTLAGLSLVLFVTAAWLNVPLTHTFAVAALIMTGSTLLPIEPLDGAKLSKAGAVAAAGVIGGAVLVNLGIV